MDRSYDSLRHQEMFWADFKDVSELEILLEGNTYTITSDKKEDERRFTANTAVLGSCGGGAILYG